MVILFDILFSALYLIAYLKLGKQKPAHNEQAFRFKQSIEIGRHYKTLTAFRSANAFSKRVTIDS